GAGIDVRVINDRHAVPLPFSPSNRQQILGVDEVRGPRVAWMPHRISGMQLVLDVAARNEHAVGFRSATNEQDAAALGRILGLGLRLDLVQLVRKEDHVMRRTSRSSPGAPPARAGMIDTSSPSRSAVASPWRASMPSLLT